LSLLPAAGARTDQSRVGLSGWAVADAGV